MEESFAGVAPGTKDLIIGTGLSGQLTKGRTYLIDAYKNQDGNLFPAACGSTDELASVADFVDYLRQRAAGKAKTVLAVRVNDQYKPLLGASVTISGPGAALTQMTDISGIATFADMKAGRYRISAGKAHYTLDADSHSDEDVDVSEGACPGARIVLRSDAAVSGVVLDSAGVPVADVRLSLVPFPEAGEPPLDYAVAWAESNANGEFRFDGVAAARYYLGTNMTGVRDSPVPRTFYPGKRDKASGVAIDVKIGEAMENLVLNLPDFGAARRIEICVIDTEGKPAPSAVIKDSFGKDGPDFARLSETLTADETGCARATGLTRAAYAIDASLFRADGGYRSASHSDVLVIDPGEAGVHVVLKLKPFLPPSK